MHARTARRRLGAADRASSGDAEAALIPHLVSRKASVTAAPRLRLPRTASVSFTAEEVGGCGLLLGLGRR
jgi:hypothetical protein